MRANVLLTNVAIFLDLIQRSSANSIADANTERHTDCHTKSVDAGAATQRADNFGFAFLT